MKANRGLKEMIKLSRGSTNDENNENSAFYTLPKIEKKAINDEKETYNFTNGGTGANKKGGRSASSMIPKELTAGLSETEKALLDELIAKIEEQRREIDQRNQTLLAIQRNFESLSVLCKTEKTENIENKKIIAKLKEENNELQIQLTISTKKMNEILEKSKKGDQDSEQLKEERKKVLKYKDDLAILTKKLEELQKMYDKKSREYNDIDIKCKDLMNNLDKTNRIIQGFEQDKRGLVNEKDNLKSMNSNLEAQIEKLNANILELKLTIQNQQTQLNGLNIQVDEWKKKYSDVKNMTTDSNMELAQLRSENNDIKEKFKKSLEQIDTQNLQLKLLNSNEENYKREILNLLDALRDKDANMKISIEEIASLRKSLLQESERFTQYKQLIDEFERLRQKGGDNVQLINRKMIEDFQMQIKTLQEKCYGLENSLQVFHNAKSEIDSLTKKLTTFQNENMELRVSVEDLKNIQRNLSQELQLKESRINELKLQINDELRIKANIMDENERLKAETLALNHTITNLHSNLLNQGSTEKSMQKLNEEIMRLKKQIDSDMIIVNTLNEQKRNLQFIQDKNSKEIENLKQELEFKDKEIKNLKDKYTKELAEKDKLMGKLKEQQEESFKAIMAKLEKENQNSMLLLQNEINELKSLIEKKDEQLDGQQKLNEKINEELKNVKSKYLEQEQQLQVFIKKEKENEILMKDRTGIVQKYLVEIKEQKEAYDKLSMELNRVNKLFEEKKNAWEQISEQKRISLEKAYVDYKNLKQDYDILTTKSENLANQLEKLKDVKNKIQELETKESTLVNVIVKLEHAESSLINSLACNFCMELANAPITCIPCGHTFCTKCLDEKNHYCPECKDENGYIDYRFRNKLIDEIITKLQYNKITFEAIFKQYGKK